MSQHSPMPPHRWPPPFNLKEMIVRLLVYANYLIRAYRLPEHPRDLVHDAIAWVLEPWQAEVCQRALAARILPISSDDWMYRRAKNRVLTLVRALARKQDRLRSDIPIEEIGGKADKPQVDVSELLTCLSEYSAALGYQPLSHMVAALQRDAQGALDTKAGLQRVTWYRCKAILRRWYRITSSGQGQARRPLDNEHDDPTESLVLRAWAAGFLQIHEVAAWSGLDENEIVEAVRAILGVPGRTRKAA